MTKDQQRPCGGLMRRALAGLLAFCLVGLPPVHAFMQTGSSGVYQTPDGFLKAIISTSSGVEGLFIAYSKEAIPLQEFNPEKLATSGVNHLFVRFDPSAEHPFSEVRLGEKVYKVGGNFSLHIGDKSEVKIDVDNLSAYLTITYQGEDKSAESMIGFYGVTEVIKGQGNLASVVAANQLADKNLRKLIKPYAVRDSQLWLGNKAVETNVGIYLKREHPCLKPGVATITGEQLMRIRAGKSDVEKATLLSKYLKESSSAINKTIVLKADQSGPAILLNIVDKTVLDLAPIQGLSAKQRICVIKPVA